MYLPFTPELNTASSCTIVLPQQPSRALRKMAATGTRTGIPTGVLRAQAMAPRRSKKLISNMCVLSVRRRRMRKSCSSNMKLTSACVYVYSSAYLSVVLPFDVFLWPLLCRSLVFSAPAHTPAYPRTHARVPDHFFVQQLSQDSRTVRTVRATRRRLKRRTKMGLDKGRGACGERRQHPTPHSHNPTQTGGKERERARERTKQRVY